MTVGQVVYGLGQFAHWGFTRDMWYRCQVLRYACQLEIDEREDIAVRLSGKSVFWLDNYRFIEPEGKRYRKGKVFCPWTSVLYVQTTDKEKEDED